MTVLERLKALRELMKERKIDAYLVPTDDFHASEYVGDYFKCRKYITGFTGSAGTAVIMQDMAGLWTDGRYFIQAEQQLAGSGIDLYRSGEPGVPSIEEFLEKELQEGQILGFDGRTISYEEGTSYRQLAEQKHASVNFLQNLASEIWTDRPDLHERGTLQRLAEPVANSDARRPNERHARGTEPYARESQRRGRDGRQVRQRPGAVRLARSGLVEPVGTASRPEAAPGPLRPFLGVRTARPELTARSQKGPFIHLWFIKT